MRKARKPDTSSSPRLLFCLGLNGLVWPACCRNVHPRTASTEAEGEAAYARGRSEKCEQREAGAKERASEEGSERGREGRSEQASERARKGAS
eukprot:2929693-Pleurochrysis_carterae.AAC.1